MLKTAEVIAIVLACLLTAVTYPVAASLFISPSIASSWKLPIAIIFGVLLPMSVIIMGIVTKLVKSTSLTDES